MDQRAENSCGSHGADKYGQPLFDYTCDDCMLPYNHKEYDEDPAYIRAHGEQQTRKIKRAGRASRTSRRLGAVRNNARVRRLDNTTRGSEPDLQAPF